MRSVYMVAELETKWSKIVTSAAVYTVPLSALFSYYKRAQIVMAQVILCNNFAQVTGPVSMQRLLYLWLLWSTINVVSVRPIVS